MNLPNTRNTGLKITKLHFLSVLRRLILLGKAYIPMTELKSGIRKNGKKYLIKEFQDFGAKYKLLVVNFPGLSVNYQIIIPSREAGFF